MHGLDLGSQGRAVGFKIRHPFAGSTGGMVFAAVKHIVSVHQGQHPLDEPVMVFGKSFHLAAQEHGITHAQLVPLPHDVDIFIVFRFPGIPGRDKGFPLLCFFRCLGKGLIFFQVCLIDLTGCIHIMILPLSYLSGQSRDAQGYQVSPDGFSFGLDHKEAVDAGQPHLPEFCNRFFSLNRPVIPDNSQHQGDHCHHTKSQQQFGAKLYIP